MRDESSELSGRGGRRTATAFLLGLAALITAAIAAVGPAVPDRAVYTWPPADLPDSQPTRTWFAPLLVARHSAESFTARIPCESPTAVLEGAGDRVVLLATARDVATNHALGVTWSRSTGVTNVRIGRTVVAHVPASHPRPCRLDVQMAGVDWSVRLPDGSFRRGRLAYPPRILGLVTELDLAAKPPLEVTVRPYPQDTHPSTRQTVLRVSTALLLAAALALLFMPWRWPLRRALTYRPTRPAAQDMVVVAVVAVWWLLAPLQDDDGWVRARQTNSLVSGGFSNYYENWGADLPLATWYEWLQRFVMTGTDSYGVHRLPEVALVLVTWFVARWCLVELTGRRPSRTDTVWWVAVAAFGVGATAFGMTLRPEPAIALLVVAILACCIRYLRSPGLEPLVVAILSAGLAVTIHPAGAVALAPLVVCARRVISDALRREGVTILEVAVLISVGAAWTTMFAVLDFDLASRDENIRLIRTGEGHSEGVLQELQRYGRLGEWGASPLRRELVAFLLISAVVAIVAWRRKRDLLERLPSASIAVGLVLLAFAPSKWIWHFGVFTGIAVVAVGLESDRFDRGHISVRARWVAAGGVLAVSLVVASKVQPWGPLDGSRVNWKAIPYLELTGAAVIVALLLARLFSRNGVRRPEAITVIAVAVALIVVTTAALAADTAASDGWTAGRQVLSSVTGGDTCGIMDDVEVPDAESLERLEPWRGHTTSGAEQRAIASTTRSRWFRVPAQGVGVFIRGDWADQRLVVSWGQSNSDRVRVIASGAADLTRAQAGAITASWWLVSERSFPRRPRGADVVRISAAPTGDASSGKLSEPFSYRARNLGRLLDRPHLKTLSSPYLFEALPCATLPRLELGVAEPPNLLLDRGPPPLTNVTSPFVGVGDMFTVWKAPLESRNGRGSYYLWGTVTAYWVATDPRDAIAPATRRRYE
jgi:hypothetical protein